MDPISLLTGINLFVSMSANFSAAKKGLKTSLTKVKERPKTFLQKIPPNISALILITIILGVFKIGTLDFENSDGFLIVRVLGLALFIIFSWTQVWSFKHLGKNYSQEIIIQKEQKLITTGPYKLIRHPQYLSQILSDLGAGLALGGYIIIPLVLLVELPLFILRAKKEEELHKKYFTEEFTDYKKKSGFIIPFIG